MTTPVVAVLVGDMDIDDKWADTAVGARAPTLQAPATSPPAPVAVAAIPTVEHDVTAEVLALGAEDSILKLGMTVTVVNGRNGGVLDGNTAVITGRPTPPSHSWECTLRSGSQRGEKMRCPPECLRPIQGASAPPKRTTAYDPF